MKKLLLVGSGGHCKSVLDCLNLSGEYDELGIVSNDLPQATLFCGQTVVGSDHDLEQLYQRGYTDAFIAVGSVGDVRIRVRLANLVKSMGFSLPCIVDPSAVVSNAVVLGVGVFIGKNAVINTHTLLGDCCILNTGCIVEHDCTVGAFAHISPGAVLCGTVAVGYNSHIGANATVLQGITIGNDVIVGAGSVVTKSIECNVKGFGNPFKVV